MRFTPGHVLKIIDRLKWLTRRVWQDEWRIEYRYPDMQNGGWQEIIHAIRDKHGRLKWEVGRSYAVQIGGGALYGRPAVARFVLEEIRKELLQAISEDDAISEGCIPDCPACNGTGWATQRVYCSPCRGSGWHNAADWSSVKEYEYLWNSINKRPCHQWPANPDVAVLKWDPASVEVVRPDEIAALREKEKAGER